MKAAELRSKIEALAELVTTLEAQRLSRNDLLARVREQLEAVRLPTASYSDLLHRSIAGQHQALREPMLVDGGVGPGILSVDAVGLGDLILLLGIEPIAQRITGALDEHCGPLDEPDRQAAIKRARVDLAKLEREELTSLTRELDDGRLVAWRDDTNVDLLLEVWAR
jgi:hypothetical protein